MGGVATFSGLTLPQVADYSLGVSSGNLYVIPTIIIAGTTPASQLVLMAQPGFAQATATAAISGGDLSAITVTDGGGGYRGVPTVTISGGGGSGATAVAVSASTWGVIAITIANPGSGYTSAPTITMPRPTSRRQPRPRSAAAPSTDWPSTTAAPATRSCRR